MDEMNQSRMDEYCYRYICTCNGVLGGVEGLGLGSSFAITVHVSTVAARRRPSSRLAMMRPLDRFFLLAVLIRVIHSIRK